MDISSSRDSPPSLSTSACPNRLLSRLRCSAVKAVEKKKPPTKQMWQQISLLKVAGTIYD